MKPLNRIGFHNLMQDAGYSRRREWRRQWPQGVALCVMLAAVALVVVLA